MNNNGFTLVEIAVVLTIIALLIGGIVQGNQMIKNSAITATITKMNSIQAALNSFQDVYKKLPGDMSNANLKIPNCIAINNCDNGNGDNLIGSRTSFRFGMNTSGPLGSSTAAEKWLFWKHLALAGIITDINISDNGTEKGIPVADIGGFFTVGNARGQNNCNTGPNFKMGIWLSLVKLSFGNCTSDDAFPVGTIASIDRKIDDAKPNSGSFRSGNGNAITCVIASGSEEIYDEANPSSSCLGLYFLQ